MDRLIIIYRKKNHFLSTAPMYNVMKWLKYVVLTLR